jgi:hypothetical protein
LARHMDRRIATMEKRAKGLDSGLRLHLREEAVQRQRQAEENRERIAKEDEDAVRLKLETKLAHLRLAAERTKTKRSSNKVRRAEIEQKEARAQAKLEANKEKQFQDRVAQQFAADLFGKLKGLSEKKRKVLTEVAGRRRLNRFPSRLRHLWFADVKRSSLRMILPQRAGKEALVYASETFTWELFAGKRPQDLPPLVAHPVHRLKLMFNACLPGWEQLLPRRWTIGNLLGLSDHVADHAFLRGVWAYSRIIGKEHFPEGLWQWPPKAWDASSSTKDPRRPAVTASASATRAPCSRPPTRAEGPAAREAPPLRKRKSEPPVSASGLSPFKKAVASSPSAADEKLSAETLGSTPAARARELPALPDRHAAAAASGAAPPRKRKSEAATSPSSGDRPWFKMG